MHDVHLISTYLGEIVFGTFFIVAAMIAALIALLRRGHPFGMLIWLSVWSGLYGLRLLMLTPPVRLINPCILESAIQVVDVIITYLMLSAGLLAMHYLTRDRLEHFFRIMIAVSIIIGVTGITWYLFTSQNDTLMLYNNLVAVGVLLIFGAVLFRKKWSEKYLALPGRSLLSAAVLVSITEGLYSNFARIFGYQTSATAGWLAFAFLLFSLAFVSVRIIVNNERRLIAVENELDTARNIQFSILPKSSPALKGARIAASYIPMNAVGGDFYEFIQISKHEAGIFIADVSGHGVPAALIASMIKTAIHSAEEHATNPGGVLSVLRVILGKLLQDGQFVTAAYLYIDMQNRIAKYSAAGHPPMLYSDSSSDQTSFVESNGLLFGVDSETEYPVKEFSFHKGDRFMLYTDGVTEAQNMDKMMYDDKRLARLIYDNADKTAEELDRLVSDSLTAWQGKKAAPNDDMTWIIVDVYL